MVRLILFSFLFVLGLGTGKFYSYLSTDQMTAGRSAEIEDLKKVDVALPGKVVVEHPKEIQIESSKKVVKQKTKKAAEDFGDDMAVADYFEGREPSAEDQTYLESERNQIMAELESEKYNAIKAKPFKDLNVEKDVELTQSK